MSEESPLASFRKCLPKGTSDLAHEIWQEINHLQGVWGCFLELYAASKERVELLNESAGPFFRLNQQLLQHEVWLSISRLTDPAHSRDRVNSSLSALVSRMRENGFEEAAGELGPVLNELLERVGPIRGQRNRVIAHADLDDKLMLREEGLPGIAKDELEGVVEDTSAFFNEIEKAIGKPITGFVASRSHARAGDVIFRLEEAKKKIESDRH